MGGPYKKKPKPRKDFKRDWKTKRRFKDIDEIDEDMKEKNAHKLLHQEVDYDKTGAGQHYCLHCARYFINNEAMLSHFKTKGHKKRLKALELEPYSQGEAERASGKGSYFEPKKRKIETQPIEDYKFDAATGEAERPSEKGSYFEPKRRKVETQPIDDCGLDAAYKYVDVT